MSSDVQKILKCLSDWAANARKGEVDDCYVLGSLTYQDGGMFNRQAYDSDVDLVVKLRSDLDALARSEVLKAFRADKLKLEEQLTKVLGVDDVSKPIVSALVVTPFELASDIHKKSPACFFSANAFRNLRTSEVTSFPKSIDYGDPTTNVRFLVDAIQACLQFRNKYFAFSSNYKSSLSDYGGNDVIPKELARSAAQVAHYLSPREGVNEFDVNEGTSFMFKLVDVAAGTLAGPWQTLRQKLQRRQGRGTAVLSVDDQILLSELLFDTASQELRNLTGSGALSIIPLTQVNFVRGIQDNTVENGQFRFSLDLNVKSRNTPFVLLGFEAHYAGPDGCYCYNGEPRVRVNGDIADTVNFFEFTGPISVQSGLVQIGYSRALRPPLMIQMPVDCDYGDVRVRIKVLINGTVHTIEQFFRFELGGNLTPIVSLREPPILPDTLLSKMHGKGIITAEEFEKAGGVVAPNRYQIVKFGDYIKKALSPTGEDIPVTGELRDFLTALHERARRAEEDI